MIKGEKVMSNENGSEIFLIPFKETDCPDKMSTSISEKEFTEKRVIPYFKNQKHEILFKKTNLRNHLNPDIVSVKNNITYYTEVKKYFGEHRMQTAIGQLTYCKMILKDHENKHKYQIAVPEEYKGNRHCSEEFRTYLRDKMKIEVIFA